MKRRSLFFALFLVLALAATGWAGVAINGQPLDNVHDIMAATGHNLRAFPKNSLAVVRWNDNATAGKGSNNFNVGILGVENDKGNLAVSDPVSDGVLDQRNGGLHTAVSMRTDADGRHLGMTPVFDGNGHCGFLSYAIGTTTKNEESDDRLKYYGYTPVSTALSNIDKSVVMDVKSGLIMADGTELFVVEYACGYDGKSYSMIGQQVTGELYRQNKDKILVCCKTLFVPVNSGCTGFDSVITADDMGGGYSMAFESNALFGQARIATGDFDSDGVRDELAIVTCGGYSYSINVYKITKSGSAYTAKEICRSYPGTRGDPDQRVWVEGIDIAAGDFDGDGKTDLAVAMIDYPFWSRMENKQSSYLAIQTFKWNGSTFESVYTDVSNYGFNSDYLLSTGWHVHDALLPLNQLNMHAHSYGLLIEAGDLDGDGKDEMVTLTARCRSFWYPTDDQKAFLNLTAWKCDSGINPKIVSNKSLKSANIYLPSNEHPNPQDFIDSYLPRDFSLAVGPFSGKLNGTRACSDVALSWAGDGTNEDKRAGPESRSQHVYLFKSALDSRGKFQSFDEPITLWEDAGVPGAIGIAAGDLLGETANLEEPSHMKLEGYKSYAAVLQVPPYHVDAIQVPWASSAPAAPMNFSYLGRTVQHNNSQSSGTASDTTATTRSFSEKGWNYGADISVGKGIAKKAVKGIGFSLSAGYSGGFRDAVSQTQIEANKSSTSFTMDTSLTTALTDALMYYQTDMHIWRYPVSKPVPSWLLGSLIEAREDFDTTGEANGDVFITYTLCDEPRTVISESLNSSNYDDYAPSHEEGNLFSYPNSAARGMDNAQQVLGGVLNFTLNVNTAQSVKFTQSGSSSEAQSSTSRHTQTNGFHIKGSLTGRIKSLFQGSLGGDGSYSNTYGTEVGDSSSFTKTWSDAEGITVSAPTGDLGFNTGYVDYTTEMQTYADAAGILNTAFGVNFSDGWLWHTNTREAKQSPYVVNADPALVLPGRFNRKMARDAGGSYPVWEFNLDASSATKIRGMTFYSNVTKENVSAALEQGWPYTISVPIYNASFVDAGEVVVEFGYEAGGSQTPLERKTVTLKGWNNEDMNEPNKAVVSFDWTPDLPEGDYDFYVKLDPDKLISEIHEDWSHETPDGNNYGYHPFSVVNTAATLNLAADSDANVKQSDFSLVFVNLEAPDHGVMDTPEFRRYVMNLSEDFRAAGRIQYKGTQILTNVCVDIMRNMADGTRRHVANRHIPTLRPGRTRTFSFVVDHTKMAEGTLVVDLTSDQGGFQAENFAPSGGSTSSSSSSGCDTIGLGGALWTLTLFFVVLLFRYRKFLR